MDFTKIIVVVIVSAISSTTISVLLMNILGIKLVNLIYTKHEELIELIKKS